LDKEFFKFVMKMPYAFENYDKKFTSSIEEVYLKLENKVKQNYCIMYKRARSIYGIKINYTLRKIE